MSEAALVSGRSMPERSAGTAAIAWRNLWRNRRRTWLMVASIGFAGLLVMVMNAMQLGTLGLMAENATAFYPGHIQIQHPDYFDDPRMRRSVEGASRAVASIEQDLAVRAVAPRAIAFGLIAAEERSFGGMVIGIDAAREFTRIGRTMSEGRYLEAPGEAAIGQVLARNLSVGVGDEVAILGTGKEGNVAALYVRIVGLYSTGSPELDRSQIHISLSDVQEAFELPDEAHVLAILLDTYQDAAEVAPRLQALVAESRALTWDVLVPEVAQTIDMKMGGAYMISALLVVLVTFSIVNAFIMTIFERMSEFGMLMAVGMRWSSIGRMLSVEAFWLSIVGLAVAFAVAGALLGVLSQTGIYLGEEFADILERWHMPDRLYPAFPWRAGVEFAVVMLIAVQVAVVIPALRLRRMRVVDALRGKE